jgi:hypothetical protein
VLESNLLTGDASVGTLTEAEAALAESIDGRVFLGWLYLAQGRTEDARHLLTEARQQATEGLARPESDGFVQGLQALVSAAERHWAEALAAHEAAFEIFARYVLPFHWARFRLEWAEAHLARGESGDRERAGELLREAHAAFEKKGSQAYARVAQRRLDELEAE